MALEPVRFMTRDGKLKSFTAKVKKPVSLAAMKKKPGFKKLPPALQKRAIEVKKRGAAAWY
jgi:hypothetical protein